MLNNRKAFKTPINEAANEALGVEDRLHQETHWLKRKVEMTIERKQC